MTLNTEKCKALTLGKFTARATTNANVTLDIPYKEHMEHLEHISSMKDLGITVDSKVNFKEHIQGKVKQAGSMLAIIYRNFFNLDQNTFNLLYKSLVRSHLEYGHSVWNPYRINWVNFRQVKGTEMRSKTGKMLQEAEVQ